MNRGVLTIITVVLILAIAGVGLALFWHPGILNSNSTSNANGAANTNTATSTNTNTNSTVGLPTDFKADIRQTAKLDKRFTYRENDIPLDRVEITNGYTGVSAVPDDKKLIFVYFQREVLKQWPPIDRWMAQEIQLLGSNGATYTFDRSIFYSEDQLKAGFQSFVSFAVDAKDKNFKLRFVRDGEDVSVDLGL